ncbi:MAG: hypothetical protein JXN59_10925 [Anaerolineae bacterium]|nr:hypothetical protein [Anaerolineae bacterium]
MNRATFGIVAIAVLIVGGFITLAIIASGSTGLLPVRIQTLNPQGSTLQATPNQALGFLAFGAFAAVSLIGGGVVLGFVFRFLDREISRNRED